MSTQLALTESLWLDEEHPDRILDSLMGEGASNRKLRLLAAAYCRRIWNLLSDERSRAAIEAAEGYADKEIDAETLAKAQEAADDAIPMLPKSTRGSRAATAVELLASAAPHTHSVYRKMPRISMSGRRWGRENSVFDILAVVEVLGRIEPHDSAGDYHLLRDVFGNPFRPVKLDPSWLTETVQLVAQAAYEERILPTGELDRIRLAVLADALEEAGCTEAAILDHLRGPGPHVRGCWPVDLLLSRE